MTCNLTGTASDALGPIPGAVYRFTQDPETVTLTNGIQYQNPILVTTGSDGTFSVNLPDTDTGNPTNWTYLVDELFGARRSYHINAPAGAKNLKDLAPVSVSNGTIVYVGGGGGGATTAGNVSFAPSGGLSSVNVQAALIELDSEKQNTGLAASGVPFTPAGYVAATNVQAAITEVDAEKVPILDTIAVAPAAPLWKRVLNYTLITTLQNLRETWIGSFLASWNNEWGALRGSNPYSTFADSLVRAIIPASGAPYLGNTGNAMEIQDRRVAGNLTTWGRRWIDGRLVRNGVTVRETVVWNTGDADPTSAGTVSLPTGVTYVFNLATADTLPSWAPSGSIVIRH